uniref:CRIB domain-containing protein n=1 Tax=Eptatretus burgeri TaxID=7764 RepID=A0A8C4R2M2_EPTBU
FFIPRGDRGAAMPMSKPAETRVIKRTRGHRTELTPDMISAPLGDFRHTMHVGRGGDAFGDTSFLQQRPFIPSRDQDPGDDGDRGALGVLGRTLRRSKRSISLGRLRGAKGRRASPPSQGSPSQPVVWNRVSHLFSSPVSGRVAEDRPPAISAPLESDRRAVDPDWCVDASRALQHAESMVSFHVDLGPSMLSDVLGVLETPVLDHREPSSPQKTLLDARSSCSSSSSVVTLDGPAGSLTSPWMEVSMLPRNVVLKNHLMNVAFGYYLHHQRWKRLFSPVLGFFCLCAGFLNKLWTDLDETWWTRVCDEAELIQFWWISRYDN